MPIGLERAYAEALDRNDPLAPLRQQFYTPANTIYLDGNSLGLLSLNAEASLLRTLDEWKTLGIGGWMSADPAWFYLGEELGRRMAPLVGAEPDEVVAAGTITVNLHALVATFFQPSASRRKIVATSLDFPSDIYALQSQIVLRGGDPQADLVKVPSHDGRAIDEQAVIDAMREDVALVIMPSVLYRSGQLLDIERLTRAAHERGIIIGFDCAHSAGVVPHRFSQWGVDFAVWCNYKYLNAGPGSIGGLYVNRRHFDRTPALPGWWGYQKERQFDMSHEFESSGNAGAWQISTVAVLGAAPLLGSLELFEAAGIDRLRAKSLAATDYLMELLDGRGLTSGDYGYAIGTPREHARRGGHVAVEHEAGPKIARALKARGVVPDFRPPNVIRLAPVPLYVTFAELWDTVEHLKQIIDNNEHLMMDAQREIVA